MWYNRPVNDHIGYEEDWLKMKSLTKLRSHSRGGCFAPAPRPDAGCAGWGFVPSDGSMPGIEAAAGGGGLKIRYNGRTITLKDTIHSGWLHAGSGGNLNPALLVTDGDFDLYGDESTVERISDRVIRVTSPLTDKESGKRLDAVCHTDILAGSALAAVLLYFECGEYTPVRQIYACRARSDDGMKLAWAGWWKDVTPEEQCFGDTFLICRDLREFDINHPIIYYISDAERDLPPVVFDPPEDVTDTIVSGSLSVSLRRSGSGVSLAAISDAKCPKVRFDSADEPLFRVIVRHLAEERDEMLTSETGWDSVYKLDTPSGVRFIFERDGISATLSAVLSPDIDQIAWEADVRLRDRDLSVIRFDPPSARMRAGKDTRFFCALGPGQDIVVNEKHEMHAATPYPSIGICMQYLAIYDRAERRGIYAGFHDPEGSYKILCADCHNGVCSVIAMIPAEGIDEPMNGYHQDGQVVWRLFDGDWYDAAVIYRDWVRTCSAWFTGVKAEDRADVPEWLLKMPAWLRADANHEGWLDNIFKAKEFLGDVPLGVHLYQWHKIPFDTNYPHYNPAKEEAAAAMPVLQAAGIKVMPYINGRLWDTHDRGDYDYQFSSVARPYAAKGRNGEVITERYASKNSRGEPVELAVMCPSTALWQEKQSEINDWILNGLGCDAVYVDQIAAAPPVTCMDRSHSHRPGGGSWWYPHYYNLIDHLCRRAGKDKCYTTESNAEPFTGHIGGMLVWHWTGPFQVPAYPVVYSGYQPMLGRNYGVVSPDDGAAFRVLTAQSLCFGDQPGWMTPELLFANPSKDFFKQTVALRYKYNEYFWSGRCLRPPKLKGDIGEMTLPFESDAVISAMWEKDSGDRIVIIVNIGGGRKTVTVSPEGMDEFTVTLGPESAEIREFKK